MTVNVEAVERESYILKAKKILNKMKRIKKGRNIMTVNKLDTG